MAKIIVSSCLLGCNCRYDGKNCENKEIIELAKTHTLIPICPEQMGGLTTPRQPSERVKDRVINKIGEDVTEQYERGAGIAYRLASINDCHYAILKAKSPACGTGLIYDGTFTGGKVEGNGVCSELFQKMGIKVFTEEEIDKLLNELNG